MFNFIAKMRQQSDAKKRIFALSASFSIVVIIFGVWLSSHFFSSSNDEVAVKENTNSPVTALSKNLASAFEGMKNTTTAFKAQMSAQMGDLKVLINK